VPITAGTGLLQAQDPSRTIRNFKRINTIRTTQPSLAGRFLLDLAAVEKNNKAPRILLG